MATIVELVKKGDIPIEVKKVAEDEKRDVDYIVQGLIDGTIVIPANIYHREDKNFIPKGIGKGLKTKVNVNLGTSADIEDLQLELEKLKVALKYGTDAVMDLSTGKDIETTRKVIVANSPVMVGTVPIYEAVVEAVEKHEFIGKMTPDELFDVIERHCKDGVDFITVHCGVTLSSLERLQKEGRIMNIVSRGGSLIAEWMVYNEKENPLYEQYDRLLEIAKKYDVTLSLGDGMRPGCLADATDRCQIEELITLGELVDRARKADVQVMVEGPGHVPLNQVEANIILQKRLCHEAPFYVLGPIVTDIAPGYDHITAAIGGAIAAKAGADFLCYVTPAEHLALPDVNDVREGLIASKIAGHAADIVKGVPGAIDWDVAMAKARDELDWEKQFELAIDPDKAREYREKRAPKKDEETCSMCGNLCAVKTFNERVKKSK
ncbi:phosphomethylpyrimidine synthase ThiC [Desulfurobacterium atlanticum]|uniref:Phosphomethylpyrimidine synthase n=1 Tax=Desulfurobacterium atlanticum TaxID=240169 RepID=A0A238YYG7_9BACT|nr:phosphomethylpyrimidine synthase ThiC [Desulfurobacterium atlanticum]SNR76032.1 hydroxymethylpyrimidine synthase [Desulfurobacterium atlanticum]